MMSETRQVLVFVGHRRSLASILLIWGLAKKVPSVKITGVICPTEFRWKRVIVWYRRFGIRICGKIFAEIGLLRNKKLKINDEYEPLYDLSRKWGIQSKSVNKLCSHLGIPFHMVKDINTAKSVELVTSLSPDCAIYSGAGILRKPIIQASKKVLNIHCGPLPLIRGMNAVEWTLFQGLIPEVTLHYIDEGIDTGKIIASRKFKLKTEDSLERLRGLSVVTGLKLLIDFLNDIHAFKEKENFTEIGYQYFSMAEPIKFHLRKWIKSGKTPRSH